MLAGHLSEGLNCEQRSRWVALLSQAAREAGLPAEPEFRAAFTSFIEWDPLIASPQGAAGGAGMPVPRWHWTPAGPPSGPVTEPHPAGDQPAAPPRPGPPVSSA